MGGKNNPDGKCNPEIDGKQPKSSLERRIEIGNRGSQGDQDEDSQTILSLEDAKAYIKSGIEDDFIGLDPTLLGQMEEKAYVLLLSKRKKKRYTAEDIQEGIDSMMPRLEGFADSYVRANSQPTAEFLEDEEKGGQILEEEHREKREPNDITPAQSTQDFIKNLPVYEINMKGDITWEDAVDQIFKAHGSRTICLAVQKALRYNGIYPRRNEKELMTYISVRQTASFFYEEGLKEVDKDEAMFILNSMLPCYKAPPVYFDKKREDGSFLFPKQGCSVDIIHVIGYIRSHDDYKRISVSREMVREIADKIIKRE
ncbi:MAG: hypothetical protein NT001_01480 [Candidatus Woesearchaeota archaeon]|nr:hypothetical protein [Candidatus Woesearchaeota archaeon]